MNPNKNELKNDKKKKIKGSQKEVIFEFSDYLNKEITVYFNGGRIASGIVKSYDQLSNLVLDEVKEQVNEEYTRELGLVFIKGSNVSKYSLNTLDILRSSWKS